MPGQVVSRSPLRLSLVPQLAGVPAQLPLAEIAAVCAAAGVDAPNADKARTSAASAARRRAALPPEVRERRLPPLRPTLGGGGGGGGGSQTRRRWRRSAAPPASTFGAFGARVPPPQASRKINTRGVFAAGSRLRRRFGACGLRTRGPGGALRLRTEDGGEVRLPPARARRPGLRAGVHRAYIGKVRVLAGADQPAAQAARGDQRGGGPAGAQGPGAERPAGLPARGHRASGRQGRAQGRLRRQRRTIAHKSADT